MLCTPPYMLVFGHTLDGARVIEGPVIRDGTELMLTVSDGDEM